MNKEINILGAGPSGLTAAINLAQAGYRVNVYEIRKDAGARFNGDLQGVENWVHPMDMHTELKQFNLRTNFDLDPFNRLEVSDGRKLHSIDFTHPLFYLIKRGATPGCLDHALKMQALDEGVSLYFNQTLPRKEADIIATGPAPGNMLAVARGIIFKTNSPDRALVILNNRVTNKGYAYLLVTNGYGCLCTTVFDGLERADEYFESTRTQVLEMTGIDFIDEKKVGGYVNFSSQASFEENSTLLTGEAAGLQDFLWGFGVRQAIRSGYVAARSIIEKMSYAPEAEKHFRPMLKAGIVNRFLWEYFGQKTFPYIVRSSLNHNVARYKLYSFYGFNTFQKMIYPFAYFSMKRKYPGLIH